MIKVRIELKVGEFISDDHEWLLIEMVVSLFVFEIKVVMNLFDMEISMPLG